MPQTRGTLVDSGRLHPFSGEPLYSAKASYAMGRDDDDPSTGLGPCQAGGDPNGFSHSDSMSCQACHSAWTNTCMGCHLEGEYTNGNEFSNITGQRIVFRQKVADFVCQSPVFFQLGVGPDHRITQMAANTRVFFRYEGKDNQRSPVFAFSDRNGGGNNPAAAAPDLSSMSHNAMLAHPIRGKVTPQEEGPRYCVSCHLTTDGLATWSQEYGALRTAPAGRDHAALDFDRLSTHFGRNTENPMDSPLWVHMVAGLGTGPFLFDEQGRPVNPLDTNPARAGCDGEAPASAARWGRG